MRPCVADGLRRIDEVHVFVDERPPRALVVGIGHRVPASAPITLAGAARLAVSGIPVHIHGGPVERA
jgi:hypothetical protein